MIAWYLFLKKTERYFYIIMDLEKKIWSLKLALMKMVAPFF